MLKPRKRLTNLNLTVFSSSSHQSDKRAISGKTSAWVSVLPIATCHFDLSPAQFRDVLAVRYIHDPTDLPSKCDGCGATLTMQHALDCKVGGLVIQRHNEIRDCIGDIAVWTQVVREPIVREAHIRAGDSGLRLDLGVHGVWQPQAVALFDFKVIDTDAPSYSSRSPESVLESGAQDKKRDLQASSGRL